MMSAQLRVGLQMSWWKTLRPEWVPRGKQKMHQNEIPLDCKLGMICPMTHPILLP